MPRNRPGGAGAIPRALSACILILLGAACAHGGGAGPERTEADGAEADGAGIAGVRLRYRPEDAAVAQQVREALRRAVPAAQRWGRLSTSVLITIHPTHGALEAAAHREGYPWLRAWARYASVELQSPRTWSRGGATDAEMAQLLTHELAHCAMYQSAAREATWRDRRIPIWFREGMAGVAAGQDPGPVPAEAIWRYYRDQGAGRGARDPLAGLEPAYRSESPLVYATAYRAFRFLVDRYGDERVRRVVAGMGRGRDFRDAFREAVGIPVQDFEDDFRRYVLWQGWRN